MLHEVIESYVAGQASQQTGKAAPSTFMEVDNNTPYFNAHKKANDIDPRHKDNYIPVDKKDGHYLKNIDTGKTLQIIKY